MKYSKYIKATSGRSRSRWDLRLRPHRNWAGDSPETLCGVIRKLRRKRANLLSTDPSPCFFIPCMLKRLYRSLNQTICTWVVRCWGNVLDAIFLQKWLKFLLTKLDPLLDTTISGKPCEEKIDLILCMVTLEVAEFTQWISIHLEWASMIWIRSETVNIAGYQMRLLVWRVLPWVAEGFLAFGGNFPCRPKAEAARKTSGTERCFLPSPLTFERFYRITFTQWRQLRWPTCVSFQRLLVSLYIYYCRVFTTPRLCKFTEIL